MPSLDSVLLLWLHVKGVAHVKMTPSGTRGTRCGSRGGYDCRFNAVSSSPQVQTKPETHPFLKCSRYMKNGHIATCSHVVILEILLKMTLKFSVSCM